MATEKDPVPLSIETQRRASQAAHDAHSPVVQYFPLFQQLKQRNVFRVAALYVGMAYVLLEIFELFFHLLELPPWAGRTAVLIAVLGFPVALVFAWVYEVTPEGLKPTAEVPHGQSIRRLTGRRLDRAIIAVLAVALTYFLIDKLWVSKHVASSAISSARSGSAAIPEKSIAVLPFVDLSEKHDQEYFADGMAEEVLDLLANVPRLKVIGRTSSFQFKGKSQDLRTVGSALGARYVVEGSVRKSGERMRVTAQLIDSQDGSHVWSDTYDEPVGDALKVQDQIATGLVRALQISIGADSGAQGSSFKSGEAYELYLRGRHAVDRNDKEGLEQGAAYFQQALGLEPTAGVGVAWLAITLQEQAAFDYVEQKSGYEHARSLAHQALALDPNSWAARVVLTWIQLQYDRNWAAAERNAKEAMGLRPRHPWTLSTVAEVCLALGRWDEGTRLTRAALAVDPFDAQLHLQLSEFQLVAGDFKGAEASNRRMLRINPNFGEGHLDLGRILLLQKNFEAALTEIQQEQTDWSRYAGLAMVYYALGRRAESDASLAEVVKGGAEGYGSEIAAAYAYRGDADQAFAWLERAYRDRDTGLYAIKSDPFLSMLKGDPRYAAFLHKMNLPE